MIESIRLLKGKQKITALTAYDVSSAQVLCEAGVDVILVGDSLGMVVLGYPDTHSVTMDDMIRHTQAVVRGVERERSKRAEFSSRPLVVADMPIGTCDFPELAVENCKRMIRETGAHAVKIEGLPESCVAVVSSGIPVMGHTGLKPQTAETMRVQGRDAEAADAILDEAKALEYAGCFAVVLECVPTSLGQSITRELAIPTIGIGAGPDCDGQILVSHDMWGLFPDFRPKFVKRYGDVRAVMLSSTRDFVREVREGVFPRDGEFY